MLFINVAEAQLSDINKAQGQENQVCMIIWPTKEKMTVDINTMYDSYM